MKLFMSLRFYFPEKNRQGLKISNANTTPFSLSLSALWVTNLSFPRARLWALNQDFQSESECNKKVFLAFFSFDDDSKVVRWVSVTSENWRGRVFALSSYFFLRGERKKERKP